MRIDVVYFRALAHSLRVVKAGALGDFFAPALEGRAKHERRKGGDKNPAT